MRHKQRRKNSQLRVPSAAAPDAAHPDVLNDIEAAVLRLYAGGSKRSEIARQLELSANTIGHHLTMAKDKLHARSLAHAVFLLARADR